MIFLREGIKEGIKGQNNIPKSIRLLFASQIRRHIHLKVHRQLADHLPAEGLLAGQHFRNHRFQTT